MFDIPQSISVQARERNAELSGGATALPMAAGPKWVCQIIPAAPEPLTTLSSAQRLAAQALLRQLRPLNIALGCCEAAEPTLLACSERDGDGLVHAYARVRPDRTIEIAGVLPTGFWQPEHRAWWPGSYEIPLLKQASAVFTPLLNALQLGCPTYLCMSLLGVQGSALIAKGQSGTERPYPIPAGVDTIQLPPVRVDAFTESTREMLIAALDQVRVCARVALPRPFYL